MSKGSSPVSANAPGYPESTRRQALSWTRRVDRRTPSSSTPKTWTNVQSTSSPGRARAARSRLNGWTFVQGLVLCLTIFSFAGGLVQHAHAAPTGGQFDHIVIIAMENQNYGSVFGSGTGSSNAPFLSSLLALGSTIPQYHSYGAGIGGCSAGCYQAFTEGFQTVSDSWCPRASSPCQTGSTSIADQLSSAGLTSAAFCEDGCPRGADHFPWIGYTSTWNSCVTGSFTCSGQSGPSGMALYNSVSANGNLQFINYLSGGAANYVWFTPTDSHNMHDNSVSSGDAYLQNLLIGSGTLANPSASSVLGSSLFNGSTRTALYLWWDEYDPSPNLLLAKPNGIVKLGFVSSANNYNEYSSLKTIENNWGLGQLQNAASASLMSDIFGVSIPTPLATSFTFSGITAAPSPVTFSASATGGTSPYSFSWTFGDGSSGSGATPSHTYTTAGSYSVVLTASDTASHSAQSTQSITIPAACSGASCCTSNCCTTNCGAQTPGQLAGWGGIRLDEASLSGLRQNTQNLPSCCFTGEVATNMQIAIVRMQSLGYNAVRVDFDPTCTDNTDNNYMSAYSAANLQRAITIAQNYGFWIIIDYHGFTDIIAGSSTGLVQSGYSDLRSCWLGVWSPIINQFKGSYSKIIWEPLNEPRPNSGSDVATLSSGYQAWINQDRQLGDQHWIVVGNICSYGCTLSDFSQGYPTVTDSLGRVFINLHAYMGFPYLTPWTNQEADTYAYQFYQWVLAGQTRTGWPSLNTEVGADPLCSVTVCPNAGWGQCGTPPTTCGGSAGYTTVSFEFVKSLIGLFNKNSPPISWIGWTAGSWTDTPGAPLLGALDPTNWGTMLGSITLTNSTGTGGGGTNFLNLIIQNAGLVLISAAAIVGVSLAVAAGTGRKRRSAPISR